MRKIIQHLLSTFGAQYNSEVNVLVSTWFATEYQLHDMTVTLSDVNEQYIVRALENALQGANMTIADMASVAVLPSLSPNKCDMLVKVVFMPELLEKLLTGFAKVEYGFWSEKDKVEIQGADKHITLKKAKVGGELQGMYLNGTLADNDTFSIFFDVNELNAVFDSAKNMKLNGVIVPDGELLDGLVLRTLFYRLLDSDIGFKFEMDHLTEFEQLKAQVWPTREEEGEKPKNNFIFSSWGERIGVSFNKFNFTDIKEAQTKQPPTRKKHLSVVANNEDILPEVSSDHEDYNSTEVCTSWGMY